MSIPPRYAYVAVDGDAVYRIPDPHAFGFMFACGGDGDGAQLPAAVLLRGGRVYPMRPDLVRGSGYVLDVKPAAGTNPTGTTEAQFLMAANYKWRVWAVAAGIDPADGGVAAAPVWKSAGSVLASLSIAATAWGWVAA